MNPALLDSDMLSEVIKGVDAQVALCSAVYLERFGRLSFTSASVFEILYGLHRKRAYGQIARATAVFAANREVVPDTDDYRLAAEVSGALDRQGTPIGLIDPLIAAVALRRDLVVVTGNSAHFGYIQRAGYALRTQNWREPL